jgi:3-isopropylmalate/(R)-2-methylmalate dehydratase large subunit
MAAGCRSPTRKAPRSSPRSRRNAPQFGIRYIDANAAEQGIVHVVGPEQGFSLPGTTIVCGDSHTAAHGGIGALAFGIGTSEVEHVLATQTLLLAPSKTMEVRVEGELGPGVTAKDLILAYHRTDRHRGRHRPCDRIPRRGVREDERRGKADGLQHEHRGRRARRADRARRDRLRLSEGAPLRARGADWDRALGWWRSLRTDEGARFDRSVVIDAGTIEPTVSWGTSPEDVVAVGGSVPAPESFADPAKQEAARKSLAYMGLEAGTPISEIAIENVFIGSCTNSRIEDLRAAAAVLKGRRKAEGVRWAIVVPGSGLVKRQAEAEGLDRIFTAAGFEWREPGCSACLAMNPDKVPPGERCASTSNRNFVGRQGPGARTHLLSPAMAAAAAVTGRLTDVRELLTDSPLASPGPTAP